MVWSVFYKSKIRPRMDHYHYIRAGAAKSSLSKLECKSYYNAFIFPHCNSPLTDETLLDAHCSIFNGVKRLSLSSFTARTNHAMIMAASYSVHSIFEDSSSALLPFGTDSQEPSSYQMYVLIMNAFSFLVPPILHTCNNLKKAPSTMWRYWVLYRAL